MKGLIFVAFLAGLTGAHAETFKGYQCTQDCSGHRAGYEWAKRKGVTSQQECTGNSRSFVEGCLAWAQGR